MPSRPYRYRLPHAVPPLDLTAMGKHLEKLEEERQEAFAMSRKLQAALIRARNNFECHIPLSNEKEVLLEVIAPTRPASRSPRQANLSLRVEDYVRLEAFLFFVDTGTLLPPSVCPYATDEEYLSGACMGLAQDLARYGLGRATDRDVVSVSKARDLVQEVLDYLLTFDFRNGYLRRKYDGTKYALKTLETIMYELSITGTTLPEDHEDDTNLSPMEEPDTKRKRNDEPEQSKVNLPISELEAIRTRLEHRDDLRETLIKKCRDGQKAAKQAIFALHRGDFDRSRKLLNQCEECITKDLLPIVDEEPPLRHGSFANVMEEYAEAKLLYVWLLGTTETIAESQLEKPSGILLKPEDFPISLEPEEFLGGLCDLSGEIGRYAVQRGTARDTEGVKQCLEANDSICMVIQTLERLPPGIGKKIDQLRRSVEKLERMLYEMSLTEATGGLKVETEDIDMGDHSEE